VTGRGTGLDDAQLERKRDVVERSVQRASDTFAAQGHGLTSQHLYGVPSRGSDHAVKVAGLRPLHARHLLQHVGGLEIAAMAGLMLSTAEVRCTFCQHLQPVARAHVHLQACDLSTVGVRGRVAAVEPTALMTRHGPSRLPHSCSLVR
jgi:Phosphoribosyltransferase